MQYLGDLGAEYVVFKNDEKTVDEIKAMNPRGVMISPGPGRWPSMLEGGTLVAMGRYSCASGSRGQSLKLVSHR